MLNSVKVKIPVKNGDVWFPSSSVSIMGTDAESTIHLGKVLPSQPLLKQFEERLDPRISRRSSVRSADDASERAEREVARRWVDATTRTLLWRSKEKGRRNGYESHRSDWRGAGDSPWWPVRAVNGFSVLDTGCVREPAGETRVS